VDLGSFTGGDVDGNNQVDGTDYAWLRALWDTTGPLYDVNGDGHIDDNDFPGMDGDGKIGAGNYLILKDGWHQKGDT
jgi:hypothetical protein